MPTTRMSVSFVSVSFMWDHRIGTVAEGRGLMSFVGRGLIAKSRRPEGRGGKSVGTRRSFDFGRSLRVIGSHDTVQNQQSYL